jgi:hypothetical protein
LEKGVIDAGEPLAASASGSPGGREECLAQIISTRVGRHPPALAAVGIDVLRLVG